jgi:hypothetical protein
MYMWEEVWNRQWKNTIMKSNTSLEATIAQLLSSVQHKGSLQCFQEPCIYPYHEPDKNHSTALKTHLLNSSLVLFFHLHLPLQDVHCDWSFAVYLIHATWIAHSVFLYDYVCRLCLYSDLLAFQTLSIVRYSKNKETQRFGNGICFRPQVKGETLTLLGPWSSDWGRLFLRDPTQ